MDDGYARAVTKVFVGLYRMGYLFRDNRMINWCPRCATAISDLEVEHREVDDVLYEVAYPLEGGGEVVVATVRPETMLGDTAVAVHPATSATPASSAARPIVPLAEREVPIIADAHVETDFGTGALKITPAPRPERLRDRAPARPAEIAVIGFDGRMSADAGERYAGLSTAEARARILDDLRERGLLRGEQPYRHSVGHCNRCGTRVEPLVSLQWFCRMDELAAPAIAGRARRRVRFHPKGAEGIFFDWMDAIRPWCVSRQLWWGHRLPVWYCPDGHITVEEQEPAACATCGVGRAQRDPDVLDTWFSLGALAVRDARLARGDARAARLLPGPRALDGARHHQPLGRAHDHDGHRVHRASCRSPTSRSTRRSRRPTAGACRSRWARASTRSS